MLDWCWADVVDGGPALTQHWLNISCLLGNLHKSTTILPTFVWCSFGKLTRCNLRVSLRGVGVMTVGDVVMVTGCGGVSVVQGGGRAPAVPGVPSPANHTLPRLLTWRPVERVRPRVNRHETLNQWWADAGPASKTVGQHWNNTGSFGIYWAPILPSNTGTMLGQHHRRCADIQPTLSKSDKTQPSMKNVESFTDPHKMLCEFGSMLGQPS